MTILEIIFGIVTPDTKLTAFRIQNGINIDCFDGIHIF